MKSAFLVKSPLQLLNAIEAKHHFSLEASDCVVIIMGDRKSYPQMLELVKSSGEWSKVLILSSVNIILGNYLDGYLGKEIPEIKEDLMGKIKKNSIFTVWRLNKVASLLKEVKYLFLGDYRNIYMRHFANKLIFEEVVLLDDGTATFQIADERKRGIKNQALLSLKKRLKIRIRATLQGLELSELDKVVFFSCYKVSLGKKDTIVENDFNYLRHKSRAVKNVDEVYFIGGPIVEAEIMTEKEYFEHMRKVIEYFKNYKVVYVAHRRENSEKLDRLQNNLGVPVILFDYPIEYQLSMVGPKPSILASFYSSALENCRLIFRESMLVVAFRLMGDNYKSQHTINAVYEYLSTKESNYFMLRSLT